MVRFDLLSWCIFSIIYDMRFTGNCAYELWILRVPFRDHGIMMYNVKVKCSLSGRELPSGRFFLAGAAMSWEVPCIYLLSVGSCIKSEFVFFTILQHLFAINRTWWLHDVRRQDPNFPAQVWNKYLRRRQNPYECIIGNSIFLNKNSNSREKSLEDKMRISKS